MIRKRSLIYLYVENLGNCFEKQEFTFTNKYKVNYDREKSTLNIKYNSNNSEVFFKKFNVDKINLIIGENGSGKSTILDALGSTEDFKLGAVNSRRNYKWLAIYALESENDNFLLEGYLIPRFKNVNYIEQNKISLNKKLFMQIEAIKVNQKEFKDVESIFNYDQVKPTDDESENLIYVYSRLENLESPINIMNSKKDNYKRIISSNPDISDMLDYIDNILARDKSYFIGVGLKVKGFVKDKHYFDGYEINQNSIRYRNRMKYIYGYHYTEIDQEIIGNEKLNLDRIKKTKHTFILNYLESIYVKLHERRFNKKKLKYDLSLKPFNFENRKNFLLNSIIEVLDNDIVLNKSLNIELAKGLYNDLNNIDYYWPEEVISKLKNNNTYNLAKIYMMIIMLHLNFLENIADSNIITKSEISIPIFQKVEYRRLIQNYLLVLERIKEVNYSPFLNLILFDFRLSSLSSGEIQYIKSFSNIYKSIKKIKTEDYKSCIILLDEPDMNFHPEWSRRFISTLDDILGNFKTHFSFQIIITSHSPFMVSDIPKEFITCIHIDEELSSRKVKRTVRQADFGLMSNIYDLLKESFFMKKPVGELANIFFEQLKKDIEEVSFYDLDSEKNSEKIDELLKRINLVDDPLIKKAITTFMEEKLKRTNMKKSAMLKRKERLEKELLEIEYEIQRDE